MYHVLVCRFSYSRVLHMYYICSVHSGTSTLVIGCTRTSYYLYHRSVLLRSMQFHFRSRQLHVGDLGVFVLCDTNVIITNHPHAIVLPVVVHNQHGGQKPIPWHQIFGMCAHGRLQPTRGHQTTKRNDSRGP